MILRDRLMRRVRTLPLARFQLLGTEAIFLWYFMSATRYRLWYIGTGAALVITGMVAAFPLLKLRGLVLDVAPLVVYFAYLYMAAARSPYVAQARWWVLADSVGILVFIVFWIAARNNPPDAIIGSFVRVALLMAAAVYVTTGGVGVGTRFGGYTLAYIPSALPFIWSALVGRTRRLAATGALLVCVAVLFLSRSRAPLFSSVVVLGLAMLFVGDSLRQRIKWATVLALASAVVGAIMYSMASTRFILLTFFARIARKDVLTSDFYIAAEPVDYVRVALGKFVTDNIMDAQPFGAGYMVTERFFERIYGEPYSLHSIYETWAFEGGVFCVAIVGVIFVQHLRALALVRTFGMSRDESLLALSIGLGMLGALLMGLFHQMHHGPVLYSLLGLALGLRTRVLAAHYPVLYDSRTVAV